MFHPQTLILTVFCISIFNLNVDGLYTHVTKSSKCNRIRVNRNLALQANEDNNDVASKRKRRAKSIETPIKPIENVIEKPSNIDNQVQKNSDVKPSTAYLTAEDGTTSLEDLFGLSDDQLRDLDIDELPVPREDLITGQAVQEEDSDKNKVFQLPDLNEFVKESGKQSKKSNRKQRKVSKKERVDRRNQEEYLRVMQLNPFADADESLFLDEYDILPAIFGSGKLLSIPVPYLQAGHGMLLLVASLAAFVYAPGNPLTAFPTEIRQFIKDGLLITLSINSVLAIQSYFIASKKSLPALFWAAKCFILGGIAFYEVNQAKDPTKMNDDDDDDDNDRNNREMSGVEKFGRKR